ncbi:MAG: metallophosphoesterase family protein [Planctomycetaceae bacterium]
MKFGLLSDIHEETELLRAALDRMERQRVDRVIVLGDVFCTGERIDETCRLLAETGAIGVWGNHDFGLCHEPTDTVRAKYAAGVLDFMTTLQPHLEIGECLFTHVEPWLDPVSVMDLWYFGGPPESPERLGRVFASTGRRIIFAGHFHRWMLATPAGGQTWCGEHPVRLRSDERYFVVIGALCDGHWAVFDTETGELAPGLL